MSIYPSTKVFPYVYICTHKVTGEFYIGYREANIKPSHIDLPEYMTSSKKVHNNFQAFNWIIVAEFFNGEDAYDFEQFLINESWNNPRLLNETNHYGKLRFKTNLKGVPKTERHKEKLKIARNKRLPFSEKTKYKISLGNIGKTVLEKSKQKMSTAKKGNRNPMFGKIVSEKTKEKKRQANIRYLQKLKDQNLKHPSIGFKQIRASCLFCKKDTAINIFLRFHGNNCKYKDSNDY